MGENYLLNPIFHKNRWVQYHIFKINRYNYTHRPNLTTPLTSFRRLSIQTGQFGSFVQTYADVCIKESITSCFLFLDIANADDNPMSRRKSLKKSLRESFRRLRKGRSQRNKKKSEPTTTTDPIKREL